jgi:hypothetical protein
MESLLSSNGNKSLFNLNLGDLEYSKMCSDILRMFIIQFIVQWMYFCKNPEQYSLLANEFVEFMFYILLGVSFYWLIIRKIININ